MVNAELGTTWREKKKKKKIGTQGKPLVALFQLNLPRPENQAVTFSFFGQ